MSTRLVVSTTVVMLAAALGCGGGGGGGGGGGSSVIGNGRQVVLSSGAAIVSADATVRDPSSAQDKTRLGIGGFGRSYTLTTPASEAVDMTFTSTGGALGGGVQVSDGSVTVRVAVGGRTGNAVNDLAAAGLSIRSGNLIDRGGWIETRGDGFSRVSLTGAVTRDEVLIVEREDGAGVKSHSVIELGIGPRSAINTVPQSSTAYPGLGATTPLFSSDAPIFGLPAIAASGDRVSVVCYDSIQGTGAIGSSECCVPGITRTQRRLQLDVTSGSKTMGETVVAGHDASSWRDCEIAGRFNVLAIAQSGSEGLPVSISFDRGATFPLVTDVAPGSRTRLARIFMAPDYKTGVLFWDFGTGSSATARLLLVEGAPGSFDTNNSPDSFQFAAPIVLLTTSSSSVPLVPDVKYSSCGDAFVAYGITEQLANGIGRTTIGTFRRYAGDAAFTGPVLLDDIEMIPFDPSLAVTGCGATAQVWVAYESPNGITIKRSLDGAQSFPDVVRFGTRSAYGPRLFARPAAGGATTVDCLFLDLGDQAVGTELRLFHSDADFANASIYRIVEAVPVTTSGGRNTVDAVGWFGFDATELNGRIYASVHVQRTEFFALPMGGPGGRIMTASAPSAPRVLYPGMTQPVPTFDSNATHRLSVIEIN